MKTLCVIPARYNSNRYPGKCLKEVMGKPVLQHVIERCCQAVTLDEVVVAIPKNDSSYPLKEWLKSKNVRFEEPKVAENNVLARIIAVAEEYRPKHIVRVNGDCPLIHPNMIDEAVLQMRLWAQSKDPPDYVGYRFGDVPSVLTKYGAPEVFTRQILSLWGTIPEHVTVAAYCSCNPHWIKIEGEPIHTVVDLPRDLATIEYRMKELDCNSEIST
tara:strand:+ start:1999 stop:2643 length:645 start_codon:yes stop_codon:yes gene_type:complete